jgi:Lon protease-like protein
MQESCDGRYLISLAGVCRFRLVREVEGRNGYRRGEVAVFADDLSGCDCGADVDRDALVATFRKYLVANDMEADWDSVRRASNEALVTTLSMMSPYGPAEKQALLEAATLKARAETLVAITEIALARANCDSGSTLQ